VDALILSLFGFLCGALPLAVWLGKIALRQDIRAVGDHNPGAFNVLRAGGAFWGALAIALEIAKGAFPVGVAAQIFQVEGIGLVTCAIAPVLGHAYSPFLNFRGGKAIAVSLGIWIGLTIWTVPLVGTILLIMGSLSLTVSGWALMFAMAGVGVFLLFTGARWELWLVFALNLALFIVKHRADLAKPIAFRWNK
jgi:glycerol-3-phosphate acyltransferase PlsY